MKSLVFLSILVLCTTCVPQGLSAVEPSPAFVATQPALTITGPTSSLSAVPSATPTPLLPSPTPVFEVVIDNLAISQQGRIYASGYGNGLQQLAQWAGEYWITLDTGFQQGNHNALVLDNAGHLYVEVITDSRQDMSNAIMRWDGESWKDITGTLNTVVDALKPGRLSSNIPIAALAVDGEGNLYAAGAFFYPSADHTAEFPMGYVAKWHQDTWTVLGRGFDKVNIFALAVSATGKVYVSGEQPLTPEGNYSYISQWDGNKWMQINANMPNASLQLALDQSGRLYAAGQSNTPGGYLVSWDGTGWTTLTNQLKGEAPVVLDIAVDANEQLCIGGSFESVNDIPARNIACWDGSSWHALGNGVNQQVDALAFDPGGELYAVGLFTEAGGIPANHAARWDGRAWHALGP